MPARVPRRSIVGWQLFDIPWTCVGYEMVNGSTDERLLSIFLAKSMAAIFYFNDSGRLGIERNLYQEGVNGQNKERGGGEWRLRLPGVIVILQNSVRPQTEFLIGAVKLQPNPKPNVSFGHFALGGKRERWQTMLMKKLLVSIPFSTKHLSVWKKHLR